MILAINFIPKNTQMILQLSVEYGMVARLVAWIKEYDSQIELLEGSRSVSVWLSRTQVAVFLEKLSRHYWITADKYSQFINQFIQVEKKITDSFSSSFSSYRPVPITPDLLKQKSKQLHEAIRLGHNETALQIANTTPGLLTENLFYSAGYSGYINALECAALYHNKALVEKWIICLPVNRAIFKEKNHGIPADILELLTKAPYKIIGNPPRYPYFGGAGVVGIIRYGNGKNEALQLIKEFIDHDPNCLKDLKTFKTALANGNTDILELLLQEGAVFDSATALKILQPYAEYSSALGKLQVIIRLGAALDIDNNVQVLKEVLSMYLVQRHHHAKANLLEFIKILLTLPIDWLLHQESIFILAVKSHEDLISLMLDYMDKKALCSSKNVLLVLAKYHQSLSDERISELLLASLTDDKTLNAKIFDIVFRHPSHNNKQITLIDCLLDKADINWNYLNKEGNSFLHTAALIYPSYIPIFCQKGLDINIVNRDGLSALHSLAWPKWGKKPNPNAAKLLFEQGINPFIRGDYNGATYPILNVTALQLAHIHQTTYLIGLISDYTQEYAKTHDYLPKDSVASQEKDIIVRRLGKKPLPKIRDIIQNDIMAFSHLISDIRSENCMIISNGRQLSGDELEFHRHAMVNNYQKKRRHLKGMLASQIIPEHYQSPLDGQQYSRTPEEALSNTLTGNAKHYTFCEKKSRKLGSSTYSLFSLYHDNRHPVSNFNIEHRADKKYPKGGFSERVKKGFVDDFSNPKYAIKIFKKNLLNRDSSSILRLAMRGAFCSRLLGRTGLVFGEHDKHYLVTDWCHGLPLNKINVEFLSVLSIEKRIKLALDLTRQLSILHLHGLILGDIKPCNVMISSKAIHLIDLDSAILKGEKPSFTPEFLDAELNYALQYNDYYYHYFNEKSDLYALGLTLTFLFPELFMIHQGICKMDIPGSQKRFKYRGIQLTNGIGYEAHKELCDLILRLTSQNQNNRPDSAEDFFIQLNILATNRYEQNFDLNTLGPSVVLNDNPALFAKASFKEIDAELHEYNERLACFSNGPRI